MTSPKYADEFVRKLTGPLENSLVKLFEDKQSWLYRWFEATDEQQPLLAIRKGYANIYVKGCAFKLETVDAKLVFNANYLKLGNCNQLREDLKRYLNAKGTYYAIPSRAINETSWRTQIVKAALDYIDPNSLDGKASKDRERPRVTEALVQYGLPLDCEIAFTENMVTHVADRIQQSGESIPDCFKKKDGKNKWSIKKPDALLLHRIGSKYVLRFFEAKDGDNDKEWNGRAAHPSVLDQVWFYDKLIGEYKDRLVEQYKNVLRLFGRIGAGNHPRFRPYKEFNDNHQFLDDLALDLHHDIVLLRSGESISRSDERVRLLRERLTAFPGSPQRERVHISLNATDWIN